MKNNEKKKYEAPELVAVEFKMERGYASSGGEVLGLSNDDAETGEHFEEHSSWTSAGSGFWN